MKQAKKHINFYRSIADNRKVSAGGILYRKSGKKLEVYLVKHAEYGFVLPKGGRKPNETLEQAAIREVREETGFSVPGSDYAFAPIKYSFVKEGIKVFKEVYFFAFAVREGQKGNGLKLEKGEKILETGQWFAVDRAISLLAHETEKEVVKNLLMIADALG